MAAAAARVQCASVALVLLLLSIMLQVSQAQFGSVSIDGPLYGSFQARLLTEEQYRFETQVGLTTGDADFPSVSGLALLEVLFHAGYSTVCADDGWSIDTASAFCGALGQGRALHAYRVPNVLDGVIPSVTTVSCPSADAPLASCSFQTGSSICFSLGAVLCEGDAGQIFHQALSHTVTTDVNTDTFAFGDVDGDGDLDLVVGFERQVLWHENVYGGRMAPAKKFGLTELPAAVTHVAAGDINDDGFADVLVALDDNSIWWFESTMAGTFASPAKVADYTAPSIDCLEIAPLTLKPMIVCTPDAVYFDFINGGAFNGPSDVYGGGATRVAFGDVDGDQTSDLVIATTANTVVVIIGGNGQTWGGTTTLSIDASNGLAVCKLDSDAFADIIFASGSTVNAMLGDVTSPAPSSSQLYLHNRVVTSLHCVDFNGDNVPDIGVASSQDTLWLKNNAGTVDGSTVLGSTPWASLARAEAVDVTGDGRADWAVAGTFRDFVAVLPNSASGFVAPPEYMWVGGTGPVHFASKTDADDVPDPVFQDEGTWKYASSDTASTTAVPLGDGSFSPSLAAVADMDQDGVTDVVFSGLSGSTPYLEVVFGLWSESVVHTKPVLGTGVSLDALVTLLQVADVAGSGKPDVVCATADRKLHAFVSQVAANTGGGEPSGDFTAVALGQLSFPVSALITGVLISGQAAAVVAADAAGSVWAFDIAGSVSTGFTVQKRLLVKASGGAPSSLALTDWNNDGHVDIVTGSATKLQVFRGTASGSFTAPSVLAVGKVTDLEVADILGGGQQDLFVILDQDFVYLHNDHGSAVTTTVILGVGQSALLNAIDYNNDGTTDIIASRVFSEFHNSYYSLILPAPTLGGGCNVDANCESGFASCHFCTRCKTGYILNNSTGMCESCPAIEHCTLPACSTFANLCDGCDSQFDLVDREECRAPIFGPLGHVDYSSISQSCVFECAVEAANLDNDPEFEAVYIGSDGLILFDFDPATGQSVKTVLSSDISPGITGTLAFGDVDEDGLVDIVGDDANYAFWVRNLGGGNFAAPKFYTTERCGSSRVNSMILADLDGDKHLDLAISTAIDNPSCMRWYKGDGAGNFTETALTNIRSYSSGSFDYVFMSSGLVNNDQHLDIVQVHSGVVRFYENNGTGSFALSGSVSISAVSDALVLDANDDGLGDFVVCGTHDSRAGTFLVLQDHDFIFATPKALRYGACQSVNLADFNGDGRLDVLVHTSNTGDNNLQWIENTGQGTFGSAFVINKASRDLYFASVGDMNGDGHMDAVAMSGTASATGKVAFFRNDLVDSLPPSIDCPASSVVTVRNSGSTEVTADAAAMGVVIVDNVAVDTTLYSTACDGGTPLPSTDLGVTLSLGEHDLCITARDLFGLESSCALTVTVKDAQPPTITKCLPHVVRVVTAPASSATVTLNLGLVEATDNFGVDRIEKSKTDNVFDLGRTEVVVSVYDADGNMATCTAAVTVFQLQQSTLHFIPLVASSVALFEPSPQSLADSFGSVGVYRIAPEPGSDNFPTGLTLDSRSGILTGSPVAGQSTSDRSVRLSVADTTAGSTSVSTGGQGTAPTLTVKLSFPLQAVRGHRYASVGTPFFTAVPGVDGGFLDFVFQEDSGNPLHSLPPGLSLNASSGALSGTPNTAGTYSVILQVLDVKSSQVESFDTLEVEVLERLAVTFANYATTLNVTRNGLIASELGTPGSSVTGGLAPVTYSLTDAIPGVTINSATGQLSGKPTTHGQYTFHIEARDKTGTTVNVNDAPFTLNVVDCGVEGCGFGTCIDPDPYDSTFQCDCDGVIKNDTSCGQKSSGSSNNSQSTGTIIGVTGGVLGGIFIVALLVVVVVLRRMRTADREAKKSLLDMHDRVRKRCSMDLQLTQQHDEKFRSMEMHRSSLRIEKNLGSGNFGTVDLAMLASGSNEIKTAVKRLTKEADDEEQENFLFEARLMVTMDHEAIVNVLGVCSRDRPFWLVLEYVKNGDLKAYIKRCAPTAQNPIEEVGLTAMLCVAKSIGSALVYLKERRIVHRDLAARNVLVNENIFDVKLADFGMSRSLEEKDYYKKTSNDKVPIKWMAPESISQKKYSFQSDVWSFAVLLWELLSYGAAPYPKLTAVECALAVATGYRLHKPKICPVPFYTLLRHMWAFKPEERPTMEDVLIQITEASQATNDEAAAALGYVDFTEDPSKLATMDAPPLFGEMVKQKSEEILLEGNPYQDLRDGIPANLQGDYTLASEGEAAAAGPQHDYVLGDAGEDDDTSPKKPKSATAAAASAPVSNPYVDEAEVETGYGFH